jgi:type IV secretion system protein VirB10
MTGPASEPKTFKEQADAVKLRARPRPVARLNKKVIMASAGVGALLLFAAASIALHPPKFADDEPKELYNTTSKPTAEALSTLPKSYADVKEAPVLGPPLPGDLGGTLLAAERDLGAASDDVFAEGDASFGPAPEDDAARAERIRQAKLAQESLESPVFFQVKGARAAPTDRTDASSAEQRSELTALDFTNNSRGLDAEADQNFQSSKLAFASAPDRQTLNPHGLAGPLSPYAVMAGTIIPASLLTGLNSDLPGTIIAQVTAPVYDTATGAHLLIPQGARLIGRYDSRVSFGQNRALLVWDRLILPDGASILLESLPGADPQGYAGLFDKVDHHWGRLLFASGLATLLGVGAEIGDSNDDDLIEALRDGGQESLARVTQRIVDRNLDIQPTLRVRPGWPLRIIVTRDLILDPVSDGRSL